MSFYVWSAIALVLFFLIEHFVFGPTLAPTGDGSGILAKVRQGATALIRGRFTTPFLASLTLVAFVGLSLSLRGHSSSTKSDSPHADTVGRLQPDKGAMKPEAAALTAVVPTRPTDPRSPQQEYSLRGYSDGGRPTVAALAQQGFDDAFGHVPCNCGVAIKRVVETHRAAIDYMGLLDNVEIVLQGVRAESERPPQGLMGGGDCPTGYSIHVETGVLAANQRDAQDVGLKVEEILSGTVLPQSPGDGSYWVVRNESILQVDEGGCKCDLEESADDATLSQAGNEGVDRVLKVDIHLVSSIFADNRLELKLTYKSRRPELLPIGIVYINPQDFGQCSMAEVKVRIEEIYELRDWYAVGVGGKWTMLAPDWLEVVGLDRTGNSSFSVTTMREIRSPGFAVVYSPDLHDGSIIQALIKGGRLRLAEK